MKRFQTLCLMFDYDGTLVPIAPHPSLARLSASRKKLLKRLATTSGVTVVLVTGRSLTDIRRLAEIPGVILVANHGFEVSTGQKTFYPCGRKFQKPLLSLAEEIQRGLKGIPGLVIESKGFSVAIHYRLTPKKYWPTIKQKILTISATPRKRHHLQLTSGKRLWEIRPALHWNKGKAVLWALREFARHSIPIYFGDDMTDEDAFKALRGSGVTVAVGEKPCPSAMITISEISTVWKLIGDLIKLLASSGTLWQVPRDRSA